MKRLDVLISCMGQNDMSVAAKTNVSSDVVIINQCDKDGSEERVADGHRLRMYSSTERGLSRSRNKAIDMATADVCLFCDDDERLEDDYVRKILLAYEEYPDADAIAFKVKYPLKKCWEKARKIGYLDALKIYSWQITFKRESIVRSGVRFDERFGPGTKYSPGEETIFLYACLNKGLKIYYVPSLIADVKQDNSTWFKGYTEKFFVDRGVLTRYYMGKLFATLYALQFSIMKYSRYRKDSSFPKALNNIIKGIYSKKIERPY